MAIDNDNIRGDNTLEDFTLESILAEYKGSAYIDGDKKTPPEILSEKADRIIMEANGDIESGSFESYEPTPVDDYVVVYDGNRKKRDRDTVAYTEIEPEPYMPEPVEELLPDPEPAPDHEPIFKMETQTVNEIEPEIDNSVESDDDTTFFESFQYSEIDVEEAIVEDVEKAIEQEMEYAEETRETVRKGLSIFGRKDAREDELDISDDPVLPEDPVFNEPSLKDASKIFAEACNSISLRGLTAFLITIIIAIFTFAFEAGTNLPFGLGQNHAAVSAFMMISLMVVMTLCVDIIIRGAKSLVRGGPNVESLILFSCAFSLVSGGFAIFRGDVGVLPYCVVSALSVSFAAFGERSHLRAITETLKTASGTSAPYGVFAGYNGNIDKSVLKKVHDRTNGFYNNLMNPDIAETAYRFAAPILLAAALSFAALTALVTGQGRYFLHILSAMLAAAAPFSALFAFALPFGLITKASRKSGAAIAGWGGADDICNTNGACVTDDDLFPPGTITPNGEKLFEDVTYEKALRYTASLIIASDSGLSRVFDDMLQKNGMSLIEVEDFAPYEGGVGALVHGERVMTGSAAFMNLLGIRVPEDVNLKNVVFTAVNDQLIAMFVMNYIPTKSVQSALISVLNWRIKLFFAVRDFNITPLMLEQKFKVPLEDVEYISVQNSYSISNRTAGTQEEDRIAAVLTREGFGPFAEVVTGSRRLKSTALVATIVSIVSAVAGILFMFGLSWSGAFESARPGNLVWFMLAMFAAVLVVCGYAKLRK